MDEIKILSVNKSEKRGTSKYPAEEILLDMNGIVGDGHAGKWNRQISLLDISHVEHFRKLTDSREFKYGEFSENITLKGLGSLEINRFDKFSSGNVEIEVTQTGKPFHSKFKDAGNYVMPKTGVFCRVVRPGILKASDKFTYHPKTFKILVITLSDRASTGEYEDRSGPRVRELSDIFFTKTGWRFKITNEVIPDDAKVLKGILKKAKEENDVIFTTGGTGIGPRDITPEVVKALLDKEIPGVMEMIRLKYGIEKPNALLSRGIAGVMEKSLIYTLPGSVRAVNDYMTEILKTLEHLIYMQHGIDAH